MLLYFLLIVATHACDFPIYSKITPEHKNMVYIVRNMDINKKFHEEFTLEKLNHSLFKTQIHTISPWRRPGNFKQILFADFFENNILKYENMTLTEIISYPEDRMFYPFLYSPMQIDTYEDLRRTIIPSPIDSLHSCEHLNHIGSSFHKEYFIGARGQGANFHLHGEIFTQVVSGKKLWMVIDDFEHIDMGPEELIANNINSLLKNTDVKKCIAYAGDLIHIPKNIIHGSFNYKTTLASGCIL